MKKITIIVPCYNEHEAIGPFYDEIVKVLNDKYDFHVIFVNDGSKDNTLELMKSYAEKDKRILYMSFSRNFGKEAAMYAGLECAQKINSDAAIMMDVDLQDPPYMIPKLLEAYEEGYKLIYTKHRNRKGANPFKTLCSLSFYKVYAFFTHDKDMAKGARDFCLLDRKVISAFLTIKDDKRFTKGIYHYVGFKKKCIEFDYEERVAGTTKWGFKKLLKYAFLGIKEFSRFYEIVPKIFAFLTFLVLCFDVTSGIYMECANNNPFPWNPWDHARFDVGFLVVFIILAFLFTLLYDIRNQVQNRPIYIEDETNIKEEKNERTAE